MAQKIDTPFGPRIFHEVQQNTLEWLQLRAGIPTASGTAKIVTPAKLEYSKQAESYIDHLVAERLVGSVLEFQSEAMREGHEREPESRKAFTLATGMEVKPGGFWTTEDGTVGASPDGLIERTIRVPNEAGEFHDELQRGHLELKNPNAATHIRYLRTRTLDRDYWIQVLTQFHVIGSQFAIIQSYYPDLPSVIITVDRTPEVEEAIGTLSGHLKTFCDKLQAEWQSLSGTK